jgi:leucyl/phenylalanyl-tRNA--protein transferase
MSQSLYLKENTPMPIFQLSSEIIFPPPELAREDGLLAVGGDLSPARLLTAYQMGIFPWYSEDDPILWWAPTPRLILLPKEFKLSRRLARQLKKGVFQFSMDRNFREVITQCASSRTEKREATWINQDMIKAYCLLHESGYAHSLECWQEEELAGGLYGLSIGGVFFGESMFSKVSNSSKAALAVLSQVLLDWQFDFIDCQMRTAHLLGLGAKEIPGPTFFQWLQQSILKADKKGPWTLPTSCKSQIFPYQVRRE